MATADPTPGISTPAEDTTGGLLVLLAPMPGEQLEGILERLSSAFQADNLVIAGADGIATDVWPSLTFDPLPAAETSVTLTAADFANAHQLAEKHEARGMLILGQESGSLDPAALHRLADAVLSASADLAVPCYDLPSRAGLVNSAILYPVTRALFASPVRFPLAIDLGLSRRMAERMATLAQRLPAASQRDTLVWPVNEASVCGLLIQECEAGPRALPQPVDPDLNTILASVTGSLFADVEAKAAFWQRARRPVSARAPVVHAHAADAPMDIGPMIESFRLAWSNLQDIWSLVLPPNSLLGLKRLSMAATENFRMPDNLWARIVFDFLLAYRLRTINRGHLLGALIPLYLAWVASHIGITASGVAPERHVEAVAAAFETEKAYLVSRWRWPDRFNP